jgi:hypothetical protein
VCTAGATATTRTETRARVPAAADTIAGIDARLTRNATRAAGTSPRPAASSYGASAATASAAGPVGYKVIVSVTSGGGSARQAVDHADAAVAAGALTVAAKTTERERSRKAHVVSFPAPEVDAMRCSFSCSERVRARLSAFWPS